tara:strand:- start:15811 stop:16029 length:219 start_codon:yes stop_codon:yes gene_type:complete
MNPNHLKIEKMTYFQHLWNTWKEATKCGIAADLLFLHGLCPWFFDRYFTTYVIRAYLKLKKDAWSSTTIGME